MNSKERRFKLKTTVDNFIIDTLVSFSVSGKFITLSTEVPYSEKK